MFPDYLAARHSHATKLWPLKCKQKCCFYVATYEETGCTVNFSFLLIPCDTLKQKIMVSTILREIKSREQNF